MNTQLLLALGLAAGVGVVVLALLLLVVVTAHRAGRRWEERKAEAVGLCSARVTAPRSIQAVVAGGLGLGLAVGAAAAPHLLLEQVLKIQLPVA